MFGNINFSLKLRGIKCVFNKIIKMIEIKDNITVNKAGKYEAEIITGAKINIEKGFSIPPVRNKSIPSCKSIK